MVCCKLYFYKFIFNCKFLLPAETLDIKLGIITQQLIVRTVKALHLFICSSALLYYRTYMSLREHAVHIRFISDDLGLLSNGLVHSLHILCAEFLPVHLAHNRSEGIALLLSSYRRLRSKQTLYKCPLKCVCIFSIIKCCMYVGAAVIEGREHKACLRSTCNPVSVNRCKPALIIAVEESWLCQVNRTYRSYHILKGLL